MDAAGSFHDLLSRLQAKDKAAEKRFVDVYGPIILDVARRRLGKHGLSQVLDPEDIAQEVFWRFFLRVLGKHDLASPQDLIRLLATIAKNVMQDEKRHAGRLRRGSGQRTKEHPHPDAIAAPADKPGHDLEIEEEINQIHKLLSEEEWNLVWARLADKSWPQIARALGQSADALRMKHSRALARVQEKLNPEKSKKPPPKKRPRRGRNP